MSEANEMKDSGAGRASGPDQQLVAAAAKRAWSGDDARRGARRCAGGGSLVLPLKRRWFEAIKSGEKTEEYRLATPFWEKRLIGREYSEVVVTLGYPRRDDTERRIAFPWRGFYRRVVVSPEWDNQPKEVFAIRLSEPDSEGVKRASGRRNA